MRVLPTVVEHPGAAGHGQRQRRADDECHDRRQIEQRFTLPGCEPGLGEVCGEAEQPTHPGRRGTDAHRSSPDVVAADSLRSAWTIPSRISINREHQRATLMSWVTTTSAAPAIRQVVVSNCITSWPDA
ncbi:hypothetical protein SDC9_181504 [bioreactor metagenome]|uniref:Uncharacterized protein n=1 Tax=bioreactor metagenome TaxID=1076179 RepID=A0A645H6P2_9ZZZZ